MSEKYKVIDSKTPTFITLTLVGWVDLFVRRKYTALFLDNNTMLTQRINYIHYNPIDTGFVEHERDWINSSFRAYEDNINLKNCNFEIEPIF